MKIIRMSRAGPAALLAAGGLALALAGCGGGSAAPASHSKAAATSSASPRLRAGVHPDAHLVADRRLCKIYNQGMQAMDLPSIGAAVIAYGGAVSPPLAHDVTAVVASSGSVQHDLLLQVKVAEDCALVHAGAAPVKLP